MTFTEAVEHRPDVPYQSEEQGEAVADFADARPR